MEISKTRPASNTVVFSLCFAVCFVALIHVEIELHAHRQMLQVLTQQRGETFEPRNRIPEGTLNSVFKLLQDSDSDKPNANWQKMCHLGSPAHKNCVTLRAGMVASATRKQTFFNQVSILAHFFSNITAVRAEKTHYKERLACIS